MITVEKMQHPKRTKAVAILYNGEEAGRIVSNISKSGVWTSGVWIWDGPIENFSHKVATAGGGGYCKFSHSVGFALGAPDIMGRGTKAVRDYFTDRGYQYIEVL